MALTRKFLKAMGIEDEKIDQIIEAHSETVSGLKDSLDKAEAAAKDLPNVQKELDAARDDLEAAKKDGWKDKHDALKKEYEDYKAGVSAKEAKAAKEAAARAYYESKGITGKALDIAMRGSGAEVESLELTDGKIKDAAALEALVKGDFSSLVSTIHAEGAVVSHPPVGSGSAYKSKSEIMSIKDRDKRREAIRQNIGLFEKGE